MSDVPGSELSHEGAWTEDAFLALDTAGRRTELIDGSLLVGPTADDPHDRAVAAVRAAVQAVLPDGLEVTGPVALRLSPGRILVPDLVVAARPESEVGAVRDSSVALVVIDVVGRGHGVADRWFKPQLYAGSRIPYALLVDHDDPFAVGSMLIGGRYHEYAAAEGDGVLRLEEPFALELDLTTLTAAPSAAESSSGSPDVRRPDAGQPASPESPVRGDGGGEQGASDTGAPEGSGLDDGGGSEGGGLDDGGAQNGAEHGRNGSSSADDGPHRSHPDEDHSVHA